MDMASPSTPSKRAAPGPGFLTILTVPTAWATIMSVGGDRALPRVIWSRAICSAEPFMKPMSYGIFSEGPLAWNLAAASHNAFHLDHPLFPVTPASPIVFSISSTSCGGALPHQLKLDLHIVAHLNADSERMACFAGRR